jgi:hypothetical protein
VNEPRCHKSHAMRAIVPFKWSDGVAGDALKSQDAEPTGDTWVLWYCEQCDYARAEPARPDERGAAA